MQNRTIYFLGDGYGVRGGANYLLCLIDYLLEKTKINIGLIDFKDGYMAEKLTGRNIELIDYESKEWHIAKDSIIFCPAERTVLLKNIKDSEYLSTIKIATIMWETKIGWGILYPKNILKAFAKLLAKKNALCFMDLGCKYAVEKQLHQTFENSFLPLYFFNQYTNLVANETLINKTEVNVAWLGRLSDTKCFSLLNLIKQLNKYDTTLKKRIHIIGDGLYKEQLEKDISKIKDLDVEVIFTGVLLGEELDEYLSNKADVLCAMGTAMLNGASLKLPVIGVCETSNSDLDLDKFLWLFDELDLQLGLPDNKKALKVLSPKATSLKELLDCIYVDNKKKEIGEKCYQYYTDNHVNIDKIIQKFFDIINCSSLTYKDLRRLYRVLPFVNVINTDIKLFGFPFLHITRKPGKIIYRLLGIRILKIINYSRFNKVYKLFGLFKILKMESVGKYNFPNIFNKKLK